MHTTDSTTGTVPSVMRDHVGVVISVVLLHHMYSDALSTTAKCAARAAVRYVMFISQTTAYSKHDTHIFVYMCSYVTHCKYCLRTASMRWCWRWRWRIAATAYSNGLSLSDFLDALDKVLQQLSQRYTYAVFTPRIVLATVNRQHVTQQGTVKSSIVKCMRCANAYHDTCLRDIIFLRKGKHIVCDQHELDASELAMREVRSLTTNMSSDMSSDMICIGNATHRVYAVEYTACQ
jgi:hypothetical protein